MAKSRRSIRTNFMNNFKHYRKFAAVLVASSVFASILYRRPLGSQSLTGNETFAILMGSILLWISNPVPVFVTALMGPVLAVWLQVLVETGADGVVSRISRKVAGEMVLGFMMNRIVSVALGGFVLAKALNKCLVSSSFISNTFVKYSRNGGSLCKMLLALILVPMYLSALIPHEAAVMITFNLLSPVIYSLPDDSELAKVVLLALMLGGNLGGMLSSISTPQNILLFYSSNELTFLGWLKVSLPVTFVAAIGVWIGLLVMWKPWRINEFVGQETIDTESHEPKSDSLILKLEDNNVSEAPFSPLMKYYTIIIALVTIFLWLSARYLEETLGGLGIVSLFPIVTLFGLGILDKEDLCTVPWDIILLAMGATALSSICNNSGLFNIIEREFNVILGPLSGWTRLALLCTVITFSSAIKSRYISALVYLPLAFRAIGSSSAAVGERILVAFSCSAGMLLPISGLVNAFVSQIQKPNHIGKDRATIITPMELSLAGILGTIVSLGTILTVGYAAIRLL